MSSTDQQQLGKTLWAISEQLRGAMNADDFRDYMLAAPRTHKKGGVQQLFPSAVEV